MPRKPGHTWNGLKRAKIRQDWSKENLYNLSRLTNTRTDRQTHFQQKWRAKAATRGYHNPYVREGQWSRRFDRRLPSVVPMDYKYLAQYDGSEQAAGRGSGVDVPIEELAQAAEQRRMLKTTYMNMTFHPLERRLDTAIWRALFASSAKQARQFVTSGAVKVNGKKMQYPGYLLNPGDMFSVDPERVMYAIGAMKHAKNSNENREDIRDKLHRGEEEAAVEEEEDVEAEEEEMSAEESEALAVAPEEQETPKQALKALMVRAQRILDDSKRKISGKRQQELRSFHKSVRATMSKLRGIEESALPNTIDGLETALAEIIVKIPEDNLPREEAEAPSTNAETQQSPTPSKYADAIAERNARKDAELLHAALERARANPVDSSKPYATPWRPRAWMSAFAFIPRYLEVNQNICSAVYLRHPVARPGLAEAPTPFNEETMALTFNWYLRRR